jgi:hypothetical protein
MTRASEKAIAVRNAAFAAARRAGEARDLYTRFLEAASAARSAHEDFLSALYAYDGSWQDEPGDLCSAINAASADAKEYREACHID